jgi:hypothetical protein
MTLSLPTWEMGWGAFDLAIPREGHGPPCPFMRQLKPPWRVAAPATNNIGPANARREGAQSPVPDVLADRGDALPPRQGSREGHSPLCPHVSTDREDKAPLTCAVTRTAGRSPFLPSPWEPDRHSTGNQPLRLALPHTPRGSMHPDSLCTSPCALSASGVHRNATAAQSTPAKASRGLEAGVELEDGDALRLPLRLQVRTHPTTPTPLTSTIRATFQQTRDATPTPAMPSTEPMKTVILLPGAPPSAARHPGS